MFDGAFVSKPNSLFSKTNILIHSINYMIIILYIKFTLNLLVGCREILLEIITGCIKHVQHASIKGKNAVKIAY